MYLNMEYLSIYYIGTLRPKYIIMNYMDSWGTVRGRGFRWAELEYVQDLVWGLAAVLGSGVRTSPRP